MKTILKRIMPWGMIFTIGFALMNQPPARAEEGNIDATHKYAWSENAGWENFRPTYGGVTVHETYLSGYTWAENIGWVKLGSGTGPYANTTGTDWGVNRDSTTGALSGYAWSENAGWINFSPAHGGVTISTSTNKFDGYAWGERIGWIHFQNASPEYCVMQQAGAPTVTTQPVTGMGSTTATGNGNITALGAPNPTQHGVCWNTTGNPTTEDNRTEEGAVSATGPFTAHITGLTAETKYYVRAYAENTGGTSYGAEVSFTTLPNTPSVPTATAATAVTEKSFSANWNAATGATGYRLDVSVKSDFGSYVTGYRDKDVGNVTTFSVTGLSPVTEYFYRVRAGNEGGACQSSNTIGVTTTDGTDVPAEIQDAAPNNGDGNGDGIKDRMQTHVASLPSATPGAGYMTVELAGCGQIHKVAACTCASVGKADPAYTYPFGLVGFEIPCGSATVRIYYHGATHFQKSDYRKYGPTPADWNTPIWYTMPDCTFGNKVIGTKTVPYVEFLLTEALLGDDTPVFPIVDQGGVALPNAIPTLNQWGIVILALLVSGIALGAIRRQRAKN